MARGNGVNGSPTIRERLVGELKSFFDEYPELSVSQASALALHSRATVGSFIAGTRDMNIDTADRLIRWCAGYRAAHPKRAARRPAA